MADPLVPVERRALVRQRTFLGGRICYGPKHVISVECGIRNLTSRGAMLRVPADQPLPPAFTLLHVSEAVAFDARLTWRRGETLGVSFEGRHDLRGSVDEEFKALRAIWAALAAA